MAKVTINTPPPAPPPTVTLELSREEVAQLLVVLGQISGNRYRDDRLKASFYKYSKFAPAELYDLALYSTLSRATKELFK